MRHWKDGERTATRVGFGIVALISFCGALLGDTMLKQSPPRAMVYRIEYFSSGKMIGATSHPGPLPQAQSIARDEFIRRRAHLVRIVETDGSGAIIWSESKDHN